MTGNKHYESPKLDYLEIDLGGSGFLYYTEKG